MHNLSTCYLSLGVLWALGEAALHNISHWDSQQPILISWMGKWRFTVVPGLTQRLTANVPRAPLPPLSPAPCRCWGVSLAVMNMVHVSPPWVPLSAGCRQFLCPTGQTSPGLGWVRATCLLEVQETVIRSCPHAFPLFYVFPVTKISKAKWALGPNHDAVSEELD